MGGREHKELYMESSRLCSCLLPLCFSCISLYPQSLSHVCLFETLWTTACQAPLSMEFSRQEYWSGLPFPPPGNLPDPGTELASPVSPVLQADSLSTEPPGKPKLSGATTQISIPLFKKQVMSTYHVPNCRLSSERCQLQGTSVSA